MASSNSKVELYLRALHPEGYAYGIGSDFNMLVSSVDAKFMTPTSYVQVSFTQCILHKLRTCSEDGALCLLARGDDGKIPLAYEAGLVLAGFFHTWSLRCCVSKNRRAEHRHTPPGAVGGLYGSGCLNFCSSFSVSMNSTCTSTGSACDASLKMISSKGVAPSAAAGP
jgi:hypothetical protein